MVQQPYSKNGPLEKRRGEVLHLVAPFFFGKKGDASFFDLFNQTIKDKSVQG
jgi:hypothetical protein